MTLRLWPETDIYAITASNFSLGRSNIEVVKQLLAAGIRTLQYREKELPTRQKYLECLKIREMTANYKACFIVNDNVDLAIAVEADGIHVGQNDLPISTVRKLVGDKLLIGLSTHSPEQLKEAVGSGMVDYIGVGPLFQTYTKLDVQAPVGLDYLDYALKRTQIPLVAIGGIKEYNVGAVIQHGAQCVCLVTEIVGAPDIAAKILAIRKKLKESCLIKQVPTGTRRPGR